MSGPEADGLALEARDLVAGYEPGLPIVRGATLAVRPGEVVAVLGPNGSGKSTLVKAIVGLVPVTAGTVRLFGRDVTGLPAHRLVREGLAFVPQTENVFARLDRVGEPRAGGRRAPRPAAARAHRVAVRALPRPRSACAASPPDACRAASGRCSRWPARSSSSPAS